MAPGAVFHAERSGFPNPVLRSFASPRTDDDPVVALDVAGVARARAGVAIAAATSAYRPKPCVQKLGLQLTE